jgi:Zn-dependent M16 (insulinase) family peptidase
MDHTCYTLTTAGAEGVKQLLPVYMDHILYPTLTDTGFYTEVHHIDGEGKDAGVVYCEMQACENTGSNLVYHKMMETLYENCGYGMFLTDRTVYIHIYSYNSKLLSFYYRV